MELVFPFGDELGREIGRIDVATGSAPCTGFSYAKKGGNGNTGKGLMLVRRHILFVAVFRPRHWVLKNDPGRRNCE